jgi:carbamate kinase
MAFGGVPQKAERMAHGSMIPKTIVVANYIEYGGAKKASTTKDTKLHEGNPGVAPC